MLSKLSTAALVIERRATALGSNDYGELVVEGYRWVNIDGTTARLPRCVAKTLPTQPLR
jgi:hypothetical protein